MAIATLDAARAHFRPIPHDFPRDIDGQPIDGLYTGVCSWRGCPFPAHTTPEPEPKPEDPTPVSARAYYESGRASRISPRLDRQIFLAFLSAHTGELHSLAEWDATWKLHTETCWRCGTKLPASANKRSAADGLLPAVTTCNGCGALNRTV